VIEEAQVVVHEADEPDLVGHLLDADVLAGEHGAEMDLLPPEADPAGEICAYLTRALQSGGKEVIAAAFTKRHGEGPSL
jgi:hypothetical protein